MKGLLPHYEGRLAERPGAKKQTGDFKNFRENKKKGLDPSMAGGGAPVVRHGVGWFHLQRFHLQLKLNDKLI